MMTDDEKLTYWRSIKHGMQNANIWYGYNSRWDRGYITEAIDVLENKELILDDSYKYDCYDYLFE